MKKSNKSLLSLVSALLVCLASQMVQAQSYHYWTELEKQRVYRSALDGSQVELVFGMEFNQSITHIAIDPSTGGRYFTGTIEFPHRNFADGRVAGAARGISIVRYWNVQTVGGTGLTDLLGITNPRDLEVDTVAGKIYWADRSSRLGGIYRANLNNGGGVLEQLVSLNALRGTVNYGTGLGQTLEFSYADGIALDPQAGTMCWTDPTAKDIHCSGLDGAGITQVAASLPGAAGIDIDPASGKRGHFSIGQREHYCFGLTQKTSPSSKSVQVTISALNREDKFQH